MPDCILMSIFLRRRPICLICGKSCIFAAAYYGDVLVLTALILVGKHAGLSEAGPLISTDKNLAGNSNYALAA